MLSRRHRWLWILAMLLILLLPRLLTAVAVWYVHGQAPFVGTVVLSGMPYRVWPDLLGLFWPVMALRGLLTLLVMLVWSGARSRNRHVRLRHVAAFILSLAATGTSGLETWALDIQLSSVLRDGVGPGYTVSPLARWNVASACLVTAIALFFVLWRSRGVTARHGSQDSPV